MAGRALVLETVLGPVVLGARSNADGVDAILARDFGSTGLGLAVGDRLTRAAAGQVVRNP